MGCPGFVKVKGEVVDEFEGYIKDMSGYDPTLEAFSPSDYWYLRVHPSPLLPKLLLLPAPWALLRDTYPEPQKNHKHTMMKVKILNKFPNFILGDTFVMCFSEKQKSINYPVEWSEKIYVLEKIDIQNNQVIEKIKEEKKHSSYY